MRKEGKTKRGYLERASSRKEMVGGNERKWPKAEKWFRSLGEGDTRRDEFHSVNLGLSP